MEFIDINEYNPNPNPLPSEAIKLDGQFLDNIIDGYSTLSTSGRETMKLSLRTTGNISGRDGEIFLSSDLPIRYLRVKYKLKGSTPTEFLERYDSLKSILFAKRELREIGFNDEEWIYYGYPSTLNDIDDGVLEVVGSFEILCVNPYKYSVLNLKAGSIVNVTDSKFLGYAFEVEEIQFTPSANTSKITILNGRSGDRIVINGNYLANQSIKFLFGLSPRIMRETNDITNQLDFVISSFPFFEIKQGDSLSVQNASGQLVVKYRSKRL